MFRKEKGKEVEIERVDDELDTNQEEAVSTQLSITLKFLDDNRRFFNRGEIENLYKEIQAIVDLEESTHSERLSLLENKLKDMKLIISNINKTREEKKKLLSFLESYTDMIAKIGQDGIYSKELDDGRYKLLDIYNDIKEFEIYYTDHYSKNEIINAYFKEAEIIVKNIIEKQIRIFDYKLALEDYLFKRIEKLRKEYKENGSQSALAKAKKLEDIHDRVVLTSHYETTMSFLREKIRETRIVASEHRRKGVVGFFARLFKPMTKSTKKLNKVFNLSGELKKKPEKMAKK